MKIIIKKKTVILFLLFLCFFTPYSIKLMIGSNNGSIFFYLLDRFLAFSRWIISLYMIVDTVRKKSKISKTTICVIVLCIARVVSTYMNQLFSLSFFVGIFSFIGVSLLFDKMITKSNDDLLDAGIVYFGFLSLSSVLFNVSMPYGFNNAIIKDYGIYFLGSKNSVFYFYFPFIYLLILKILVKNKKIKTKHVVIVIMLIIGSVFTNSVNSIICMVAVLVYCLCFKLIGKNNLAFSPRILTFIALGLEYIILFGKDNRIIREFVELFGRSLSFTGRDRIWAYYISQYDAHKLWGAGVNTVLEAESWGGAAIHAHNFFLDNLAKYGIIEFLSIVSFFIIAGYFISACKNRQILVWSSIALFLIVLHSFFEDLSIFQLVLFIRFMEEYCYVRYSKHYFLLKKRASTSLPLSSVSYLAN